MPSGASAQPLPAMRQTIDEAGKNWLIEFRDDNELALHEGTQPGN